MIADSSVGGEKREARIVQMWLSVALREARFYIFTVAKKSCVCTMLWVLHKVLSDEQVWILLPGFMWCHFCHTENLTLPFVEWECSYTHFFSRVI